MWRYSVFRQPVAAAKFINKSSLFVLLLGVIRRLELKPNSEQKVENIFVAPPYCQTACWLFVVLLVKYGLGILHKVLETSFSGHHFLLPIQFLSCRDSL